MGEVIEEEQEEEEEEDNYDDDLAEIPNELQHPHEQPRDTEASKGIVIPVADAEEKSHLISVNLISEMVSDLFNDTSSLFALRQNRASILCRQHQIERTINESIGLFSERTQPKQASDGDSGVRKDE